jgi:hypothetical protein
MTKIVLAYELLGQGITQGCVAEHLGISRRGRPPRGGIPAETLAIAAKYGHISPIAPARKQKTEHENEEYSHASDAADNHHCRDHAGGEGDGRSGQ